MSLQGATYTAQVLPPGQQGTIQTLDLMAKYVRDSQTDIGLIDFANGILSAFGVPARNDKAKIDAIFAYVKAAVTFRKDPYDAELVKDARRTLQTGYGDCDDIAVLLASLLACVGECPRFAVMKMTKGSPVWEHVYVEVQLGNQWLPLDTTRDPKQGKTYPGWESYYGEKAIYTIFQNGLPSGVGYANWNQFARHYTMGNLGDDFGDDGSGDFIDPNAGDPNLDFSSLDNTDWSGVLNDPGTFDPSAPLTQEESDLFDFLQTNFGGTPLYDPSLADVGIYQSSDGSTVFVNPDGTLSFQNSNGQYVGELINSAGNPVTAATVNQATAVKPPASSGGGGGGSSIPLGSAGGSKPSSSSSATSTQGIASLIDSISKAFTNIGKATGLVSPYAGYGNLTPQQAAALQLQASQGQLGLNASISPTTMLLIGGVALLLLSKK